MTDRRTGRASQNGICSSMKAVSSAFGCRPRVRPGVVALHAPRPAVTEGKA